MSRAPDRPTEHAAPSAHRDPIPRIVQVRGASGSGKTSLVRAVMTQLGRPQRWFVPGRKKPIALTFNHHSLHRPLCVLGNYEDGVATGGVDTITDKETPYALARRATHEGFDVLMEGIFISIEYWRTLYLQQDGYDRHDVFINLTVEECTEQVYRRQEAAGKPRTPLKQMADFHPRVMHTRQRLLEAGVPEETLHVAGSGDLKLVEDMVGFTRQNALTMVLRLLDRKSL